MSWLSESVRDAKVDAAAVFRLCTDPSTWPDWGHNATSAHADGWLDKEVAKLIATARGEPRSGGNSRQDGYPS